MFIEFNPLPDEVFSSDAKINCIGSPIKGIDGENVGVILDYRIVEHKLICRAEIWDEVPASGYTRDLRE